MEILLQRDPTDSPSKMREILTALRKENLEPRHEAKAWGDWIHLKGYETAISIESDRGLSRSATVEQTEEETEEPSASIMRAFGTLGWHGIDDDGKFSLQ